MNITISFASNGMQVIRIKGSDRYETAIEVSKNTFNRSNYAIVASGENYPDALVGGTLAVQLKAPILLTSKSSIKQSILEEIERLNVKQVFLLGGESAVSKSVENALKKIVKVERVAGKNRYETAAEINGRRFVLRPDQEEYAMGDVVFYVSGTNYPDALAASPLLGQSFPKYEGILAYLYLAMPNQDISPFPAIGGPTVLHNEYNTNPPEYYNPPENSDPTDYDYRIAGKNRYGTAVEVAKRYPLYLNKAIDTIVLTSGTNYPDALAAAPLVGTRNSALLLTNPKTLSKETKSYIESNKIKKIIIVGGENSISNEVVKELTN